MRLSGRLAQWFQLLRVRPSAEEGAVEGGRSAELRLREMIGASFESKDALLLGGRRIPSRSQGRRREIDLIVCTPHAIHLMEVKNWSGSLTVRGGLWIQTRRGGDVVEHRDLLAENRLRRDAVVEYLAARGVPMDAKSLRAHVIPRVVFMNPGLVLDPSVEALPDVIMRRELDGHLAGESPAKRADGMLARLVELCLSAAGTSRKGAEATEGRIPPEAYRRIVRALSEAGTWDRLQYHGGRVVAGDLIALTLGPKVLRRPEVEAKAEGLPLRLRWPRGPFLGLLKAILGLGSPGSLLLGKTRLEPTTADTVTFHVVGDRQPTTVRLTELDEILLG